MNDDMLKKCVVMSINGMGWLKLRGLVKGHMSKDPSLPPSDIYKEIFNDIYKEITGKECHEPLCSDVKNEYDFGMERIISILDGV